MRLTKCNKAFYCVIILWLVRFRLFSKSLCGSFRLCGCCDGGLSVSRGHVLFDSSADPKQRRPASVCVMAFDRRVSTGLLFRSSSSSPTHVCVSVEEWKRLSQKGLLSSLLAAWLFFCWKNVTSCRVTKADN